MLCSARQLTADYIKKADPPTMDACWIGSSAENRPCNRPDLRYLKQIQKVVFWGDGPTAKTVGLVSGTLVIP